jgi:AcrR family transcriptional regulator|tara:strand:- start:22224 stop:22892 length:669 start_codon:yes stop_codon:yes gene_type:complete
MDKLQIHIVIDPNLYTKNPESSDLGRKIVSQSIEMINELGFEAFTFKKLGTQIGSNESSIYRYFENKHMLLIYLTCWYWSWIEYQLVFATSNLPKPHDRLETAIHILTRKIDIDNSFTFINEVLLGKIIIAEANKAHHTKSVAAQNEKGYFKTYKRVVERVSQMVLEVNPTYEFPHMLISTVIEGSHQQRHFSEHLPSLTDTGKGKSPIERFYIDLVHKAIV